MPIPINYRTMPISPEDVKTILQAETDSFGTFFNLDRMLYHEGRYSRIAASRYPEFRAMCGVPTMMTRWCPPSREMAQASEERP